MTPEKLKSILSTYRGLLGRGDRLEDKNYYLRMNPGRTSIIRHISWMCEEAQTFLRPFECVCGQDHGPDPRKVEKAMRWLGFVQGCLWCLSLKSLNNLREDSMPDGEKFKTIPQVEAEKVEEEARIRAVGAMMRDRGAGEVVLPLNVDYDKLERRTAVATAQPLENRGANTGRFNSRKENK